MFTPSDLDSDYIYTAIDGNCHDDQYQGKVSVTNINGVISNSVEQLKAAIALGPVSVTVQADSDSFRLYKEGILNDADCGTQLDHAITAVGYGNDGD
jgi:hypothetical protein